MLTTLVKSLRWVGVLKPARVNGQWVELGVWQVAQDPSTSAPRIILKEERYPGKTFGKAEEDFEGKYLGHLGM